MLGFQDLGQVEQDFQNVPNAPDKQHRGQALGRDE
jgi:hypothetical protein